MKIVVLALALITGFAFQSSLKEPSITNHWQWLNPENPYDNGEIIFGQDMSVTLIQGADSIGGLNFYSDEHDEWVKLQYSVDTKPTPHHMDWLLISNKTGKTIITTKGIYDFPNDTTLRLQINDDDEGGTEPRPVSFDEDEFQQFYLKRK